MAYVQTRLVTAGQLIPGTFNELVKIKRELGLYFGAVFVVGLIADVLGFLRGGISIVATIGYFVGQYYLYRALLSRNNISIDPEIKVFSFFFMAVINGIGISLASYVFLIPAILLTAKWIMAPTYLVSEEMNLFEAIGASWRASSNNTISLTGAFIVICFAWFGITLLVGAVAAVYLVVMDTIGLSFSSLETSAVAWVGIHLFPVLMMGLSVSAYMALDERENSLVAVFE